MWVEVVAMVTLPDASVSLSEALDMTCVERAAFWRVAAALGEQREEATDKRIKQLRAKQRTDASDE